MPASFTSDTMGTMHPPRCQLARTLVSDSYLKRFIVGLSAILLLAALTACERPDPQITIVTPTSAFEPVAQSVETVPVDSSRVSSPPTPPVFPSPTLLSTLLDTPTPDPTRPPQSGGHEDYLSHSVQAGETLGQLAELYGSSVAELMEINQLGDSDFLSVGQTILVPGVTATVGPSFKIIPDSELVYGPAAGDFDVGSVVSSGGGFLRDYQEEVEERSMTGPEIVQLVADRFSVNPRLLLAVLEHRSGWVSRSLVSETEFPMGYHQSGYEGLYKQLGWAANLLNLGFYGRSEGGVTSFTLGIDERITFAGDINDGTAGVQLMLAADPLATYEEWLSEAGPDGLFATYSRLFGNPFSYGVEPLWPAQLAQPLLELPWSADEAWFFTGGPHGGWASGSAWAALDFAPPDDLLGCYVSDAWVTAMSDGLVTRSDAGAVVVDLDGDGFAGTGWAVTYMHLETRGRVEAGTFVRAGEALGHPSCEGGFSAGTHVHVARTYNGRWVSADGPVPFVMSGWESQGVGREYDGFLVRGSEAKEACGSCREESNIVRAE